MAFADAGLDAVFREVPRAAIEADTAVCFVLDRNLSLRYCNPAWDRFALANDGSHMTATHVLGKPVLEGTSGEFGDYYRSLYTKALATRMTREHPFHCSSPLVERLMTMHVYPLRTTSALLVTCSTRVERPHVVPSSDPAESCYRDVNGFIVMCGNCRRTRRAGVRPEVWDWVSAYVEKQPAAVSHGVCELCLEYYYPEVTQ